MGFGAYCDGLGAEPCSSASNCISWRAARSLCAALPWEGAAQSVKATSFSCLTNILALVLIYTSNTPLRTVRGDAAEMDRLNQAMEERFVTRRWVHPLPMPERVLDFPSCGRCMACFYLQGR